MSFEAEGCLHTEDIRHAQNFELRGDAFFEINSVERA